MTANINGMSCQHCVMAVKKALDAIPGIKNLQVEIGKAQFDCDSCDTKTIQQAIEDQGYQVNSFS